jgi:hypothetical protein
MKTLTLIPSLALALAVAAASVCAAPLGTVDQQNVVADGRVYTGQNNIGQSFVPTLDAIEAVDFQLGSLSVAASSIFVRLRDGVVGDNGLAGTPLAKSNTLVLPPDSPFEWRHFDFPSRISLTPGNTYVLELVSNNGHASNLSFNDLYPAGRSLNVGSPDVDLIFAEGLHIPEPGSAMLGMMGAISLYWFRGGWRLRVRYRH